MALLRKFEHFEVTHFWDGHIFQAFIPHWSQPQERLHHVPKWPQTCFLSKSSALNLVRMMDRKKHIQKIQVSDTETDSLIAMVNQGLQSTACIFHFQTVKSKLSISEAAFTMAVVYGHQHAKSALSIQASLMDM